LDIQDDYAMEWQLSTMEWHMQRQLYCYRGLSHSVAVSTSTGVLTPSAIKFFSKQGCLFYVAG
jgi:hypothetical protein